MNDLTAKINSISSSVQCCNCSNKITNDTEVEEKNQIVIGYEEWALCDTCIIFVRKVIIKLLGKVK